MRWMLWAAVLCATAGSDRLRRVARWVRRRKAASGRRYAAESSDVDLLGRLLVLCFAGGLALPEALALACGHLGPQVGGEIENVLRQARRSGMGSALAAGGSVTAPLLARLAAAQASGAPMAGAVEAHLEARRLQRRAESLERARTLPIKLMIPVTLLILPGILLLAIGPELLARLPDLLGPVWSP